MLRILWRLARHCAIGTGMALWCWSGSLASVDVCGQPAAYSRLSVAYHDHDESALKRSIGETNQENYNVDLQFASREDWVVGAGHRYVVLNVDPIELQTNGHLHTFFFPLHKHRQSDSRSFRFSIAPALSASSNVIKDPGEYTSDALQLLAALVWSRKLSAQAAFRYGICGDHRFGNYEVYPLVSVDWQPHADWFIELGFPTTRVTYQVSENTSSSVTIAPDGNEWSVKDKRLEKQSRVTYEATLLEWAFIWRTRKHFAITASVGRQSHNRYAVTLQDERQARLVTDSVTRVGAALEWRF